MSKNTSVCMTEMEIQSYEQMNNEDIAQNADVAKEFRRLLRSYRLAANVANTAWALVHAFDDASTNHEDIGSALEKLRGALAEYAPKYFPRAQPVLVDALERLFNEATTQPGASAPFLDWFFGAIMRLREGELE